MDDEEGFSAVDRIKSGINKPEPSAVISLQNAWINERNSPELLPYMRDEVEFIQNELQKLRERIPLMEEDKTDRLQCYLIRMDFERAQYILISYLRTRISKIERYVMYSIERETSKMSDEEKNYAIKFCDLWSAHAHDSFLSSLPEKLQDLVEPEMISAPPLDNHVIAQVLRNIGPYQIDAQSGEIVDLAKGDLIATRYNAIKALLEDGSVQLR